MHVSIVTLLCCHRRRLSHRGHQSAQPSCPAAEGVSVIAPGTVAASQVGLGAPLL